MKKVVAVPEMEYKALLGLLTDPIKREKYETEDKINKTLQNPKLTQFERGANYQSLNRKRKKLSKMIENKPIKVKLETEKERPLPTTGIKEKPESQLQEIQQQPLEQPPQEKQPQPQLSKKKNLNDYKGSLDPEKVEELISYIKENRKKFGVDLNSKGIYANKQLDWHPIENSNVENVIKFLAGEYDLPKNEEKGAAVLISRLLKDLKTKNFIGQVGTGKRYIVELPQKSIKTRKTRGLNRFKPTLWTKIQT